MLPPRTDNAGPSDDGPSDDGAAEDRPSGYGAVSRSDISQAPEDIIAYWTPERMAEATPREVRLPEPAGRTDAEADAGTGED